MPGGEEVVGGDLSGSFPGHGQIGDEAVAVGHLAIRPDDLDLQPVDGERVLAVPERHVFHPTIAMDALGRSGAHGLAEAVELHPRSDILSKSCCWMACT